MYLIYLRANNFIYQLYFSLNNIMTDKLNVLVENKNEYLEHLLDISTIPICRFFVNISNNCTSLK